MGMSGYLDVGRWTQVSSERNARGWEFQKGVVCWGATNSDYDPRPATLIGLAGVLLSEMDVHRSAQLAQFG